MPSFADRLKAADTPRETKCGSCKAIASLTPDDLAVYHQAKADGYRQKVIAAGLEVAESAYRAHLSAGHVEPR